MQYIYRSENWPILTLNWKKWPSSLLIQETELTFCFVQFGLGSGQENNNQRYIWEKKSSFVYIGKCMISDIVKVNNPFYK